MLVNHVMSSDTPSSIFDALIKYYSDISTDIEHVTTTVPVEEACIYHYHRPHLEKNLKSNSIVTVHHDLSDDDPWLDFNAFLDRYREAKTVICLNTNQSKILSKHGVNNTVVIPHGYQEKLFKKTIKTARTTFNIGIISKRYGRKVKGEAYLLELLKRIDTESIRFVLVGENRQQSYMRMKQMNIEANYYERLPYNLFGSLYEELDALLMLSHHEGGPANIPEAVASGTPVIGFNIGMVSDLIVDGKNGRILTGDLEQDALIINDLFSKTKGIRELIQNSYNFNSPSCITWKACAEKNISEYRKIVGSSSKEDLT